MPAATNGANGAAPGATMSATGGVPFVVGSNHYSEQNFQFSLVQDSSAHEYVHNITPGGFLRGIRIQVSNSGGAGSAKYHDDAPWSIIQSISLENIDGSPIKYPMNGFSWYLQNKYCAPWHGDPARGPRAHNIGHSGGNFSFELRMFPEIRDTAGVLANTDARAQYRIRITMAPASQVYSTVPATMPVTTVTGVMEAWAQTDTADLHGNPIQARPDGLAVAAITRHQILTLNAAGADNTFQLTNTGNEVRCLIIVARDSKGQRQDYLSSPVRFRLDDRSLSVFSPTTIVNKMTDFYPFLSNGTSHRETGVYVIPRFRRPGDLIGEYWLGTSNATYLVIESATPNDATNVPGTAEFISDEVVPVAPVPVELEGV
ncbi:hypothetical protein [Streptomyces noursei]|uniref:hypothetical protein n=1 Tax=Streptomyces noursei TaxID=1971 RepID=UPI0019637640|nr:hypothetical protein [Streptomyces noursei]QRX91104.1 hypothetical protein JNO44_09880 [Streptomyces noursei]